MNFSFSTNAFRKFTFEEAALAVAKAGYTGIEIMCDTPHAWPFDLTDSDVQRILRVLENRGLAIANLNAFMMCAVQDFHHPSWIEEDEDFRKVRVAYTKECIDLAARLGAPTISTEPGGPLKGMNMSREKALETFARGLDQVLPLARDKGVTVLIEPEPDLLLQTSDEFLAFMAAFPHPNLGLNFDVGHFYCMGEDPAELVKKLEGYTRHYHLEDIPETREHCHILPGQGGVDIAGVLEAVRQTGYRGYLTVELYPYLDNPGEAAALALDYIQGIDSHE